MKVILAGSTGFIGREVLEQCLQNSSIIALSRRDLPSSVASNSKLKVVILEDFLSYPESLLQDIKGAEACIWALGKARMPDNATARKVSIDYTLAAAKAFGQDSAPENRKAKKFRFVYLSGSGAERDQTKTLWFMQDYRRIRGQVENDLLAYAQEHQDTFETCIMRPGMVLSKETNIRSLIVGLGPSVRMDVLAAAMLDIALNGSEHRIMENATINQIRS
ncbi:hypothetical protein MMC30_000190 [Trapelia coarctata]|nr:hypothetical protein [Trapelia coarctata]